jgi:hypothetical protein
MKRERPHLFSGMLAHGASLPKAGIPGKDSPPPGPAGHAVTKKGRRRRICHPDDVDIRGSPPTAGCDDLWLRPAGQILRSPAALRSHIEHHAEPRLSTEHSIIGGLRLFQRVDLVH